MLDIAIRNLYLEWKDLFVDGLHIWAGSRMYRGDDVYLLDFWPLDEQNTLGAGITYEQGDHQTRFHIGVHRLNDPFQIQTIEVPDLEFGTRDVAYMERQRGIITLRHQALMNLDSSTGMKWVVYSEGHGFQAGPIARMTSIFKIFHQIGDSSSAASFRSTANVSRTSSISL